MKAFKKPEFIEVVKELFETAGIAWPFERVGSEYVLTTIFGGVSWEEIVKAYKEKRPIRLTGFDYRGEGDLPAIEGVPLALPKNAEHQIVLLQTAEGFFLAKGNSIAKLIEVPAGTKEPKEYPTGD